MSTLATPVPDLRAARRHAIVCVLAASATFAIGSAVVKALTETIPVFEIVVFRSLIGFMTMIPVLWRHGGLAAMHTRRPLGHIIRTALGFFGTVTAVYGYALLPLVTVTALGFAMPLFLTILSVPLLGERVGWRRASAVIVGLGGVVLMLQPWHDLAAAAQEPLAVSFVLAGVVAWALAMITIRKMGENGERNVTIVAWFTLGTAALALIGAIPVWVAPTPWQWLMLLTAGVMSGVAQLLMTEGYRTGETTLLAPFEYGAIVYTTILGVIVFNEWPEPLRLLGVAVLVGAGLYIWYREVTLARVRVRTP